MNIVFKPFLHIALFGYFPSNSYLALAKMRLACVAWSASLVYSCNQWSATRIVWRNTSTSFDGKVAEPAATFYPKGAPLVGALGGL